MRPRPLAKPYARRIPAVFESGDGRYTVTVQADPDYVTARWEVVAFAADAWSVAQPFASALRTKTEACRIAREWIETYERETR